MIMLIMRPNPCSEFTKHEGGRYVAIGKTKKRARAALLKAYNKEQKAIIKYQGFYSDRCCSTYEELAEKSRRGKDGYLATDWIIDEYHIKEDIGLSTL